MPVHIGSLEVRSACSLAPSAFLASAAATLPLQEEILSASLRNIEDADVTNTLAIWNSLAKSTEPSEASKHIQRAWDSHVTTTPYNEHLVNYSLPVDEVRLKAIITSHAGDWLHASPLTAVGLRLSDEAVRVAAGLRLGTNICQPHVCDVVKRLMQEGCTVWCVVRADHVIYGTRH